MKLKYLLTPLVFLVMGMFATASYADEVTGVSAPATAAQDATVSISVAGTGFCASSISYGDGTPDGSTGASFFPHSYNSHAYATPGVKTITANAAGIGCSGSASTTITIIAPVPDDPTISSVTGAGCAKKGSPYKIKVNGSGGSGICATLHVTWGDGGNNNYPSHNLTASPWRSHTYNVLGPKTINATGAGGCAGSASKNITVKTSCIYIPRPDWIYKLKFKLWVKPPWPRCPGCPPCLSCPNWERLIRGHEAQMNKYSRFAKRPGKRQAYYMRKFKMHKASRSSLIRKYNLQRNRSMKLKRGVRRAPVRTPAKRRQMK